MPGIEETNVIDALGTDKKTGEAVLVIHGPLVWDESEEQLFQLQEKLNTYVSFALDGEMQETYPDLAQCKLRIQLDTASMPGERTLEMLQAVYDQLALQEIRFELRVVERQDPSA